MASLLAKLSPLFSAMLGDIDLIFGLWVYNEELQIKFTFRSDPMIVGRVMALGLWNLAKYLVVTTFFAMLGDIDLIFGMRVYKHKSQINIEIRSGWMIFGQLTAVELWNLAKYLVVTTFFAMRGDIDLIFGMRVYRHKLQINFEIRSGWMIFRQLRPKKNMCVYCHMSKKSRVGRSGLIIFFIIDKTGNSRSRIRFRYLIFENSGKMTNYAVFLPSLFSISTKS